MICWVDGKTQDLASASIPLLAHSLHYGSAAFDGMRFYSTANGPAIFRLDDHVDRFLGSIRAIGGKSPFSKEDLKQAILKIVSSSKVNEGYIRPIGFFGDKDMELNPSETDFHIAITIWPWSHRLGEESIAVKVSKFQRTPPNCTIIRSKISGHYANSILARQDAREAGFDEALLLDHEFNIAEGPGANFFLVKDKQLITPMETNIFPGITRESVFTIAHNLGLSVKSSLLKVNDLVGADEAFFTGTAVGIVPIKRIDQFYMASEFGEVTKTLKSCYFKAAYGEDKKYSRWLTYVK